ncbi:hypothetical protein EV207_11721 [Scopulibacillus darangshiensis]|uniref:Uncharacterized protein n=1 Tax=Scopulibacillus darangshiensis TaxID=442528 RepID=A0A4R2P1I3_9BACL|nr:hypothetical protein EV207_11721 [Scopulibacillus darangshiensis]
MVGEDDLPKTIAYIRLIKEFKKGLKRNLNHDEKAFLKWLAQKHTSEIRRLKNNK